MIDLERLLSVPWVDVEYSRGYDISPDGTQAAISWNRSGQWEIYQVPLHASGEFQLLSRGTGGKFAPRYSPDGSRLAYAVDIDGSENFHIFVHDLLSGEQADLFPGITYALQPNFAWSPDGRQIAYLSDERDHFCVYSMPSTGGKERLLLDTGRPAWDVRWSPDGCWLAVTADRQGQDTGIYLLPAEGGDSRLVSQGGDPLNAREPCWSPDSKFIAFRSDLDEFYNIGLYEICSGTVTWLTDGEGDKSAPAWSADGGCLAYIHSRGAATWIAVRDLNGGGRKFQVEAGIHYLPKFTPDCSRLVFLFDNPRHPDDLWLVSLSDGRFTQLTQSLPADLAEAPFVMPEEVWYPGLDGRSVPALLYRPAQLPAPAVINIHGGPTWLYQMTWYPIMTHLASRGYLVLAPNYRGSSGYGREWQLANRFDLGGGDTDDVAAGAIYLTGEGLADPGRIAVTGRSHGGYLTMTCLTRFPELWAGGSAVVPFLNWFTSHAASRKDVQHWDLENFGDPVKDHDLWHERSPMFFLEQVRAPVQFICGGNDPRCPASESIEAGAELTKLGRQAELILYPDEGHVFLKTGNVVDSELRRVDFLLRSLENGEKP